ncbi:MAG TPA: hypothetical protein VHW01_02620, partial [Polyangiaceae bacterium]|nr:hypothetical protein [Polyangiaceae bacterium]
MALEGAPRGGVARCQRARLEAVDQHRARRDGHRLPSFKAQLGDERAASPRQVWSSVEYEIAETV